MPLEEMMPGARQSRWSRGPDVQEPSWSTWSAQPTGRARSMTKTRTGSSRHSISLERSQQPGVHADVRAAQQHRTWPAALCLFLHYVSISMAMPLYKDLLRATPYAGDYGRLSSVDEEVQTEVTKRVQAALSATLMANSLGELASSGLTGVLCDRIGRWQIALLTQLGQLLDFGMAAACAAPALGWDAFRLDHQLAFLLTARVLAGLAGNMKVPSQAFVADCSSPEAASKNFGTLAAAQGAAVIFGPIAGRICLALFGDDAVRMPFLLAFLLVLVNMSLICTLWPPTRSLEKPAPWSEANHLTLIRRTIMTTKPLQRYGTMNFMDAFALHTLFATFPVFMDHAFGWKSIQIVTFFALVGIQTPLQYMVTLRLLLKSFDELTVMKFGYVASFTAYLCFFLVGLTDFPSMMFLASVVFTTGLISNPVQIGLAIREVPRSELGRLTGAYSILETSGKLVAPLLAGVVLTASIDGPLRSLCFLAAAGVLLPGVILAFGVEKHTTSLDPNVIDVELVPQDGD